MAVLLHWIRRAAAAAALAAIVLVPHGAGAQPRNPGLDAQQRAPLAQVLSGLQPADGLARLYFVGFAGYGSEAVFKREVLAVRRLFDERFGTAGRSVALINHPSMAGRAPVA